MPNFMRHKREKVFGSGRPRPLDRNAKARIMTLARSLKRRTAKGKAYGAISAKALDVLEAIVWQFHNAATGLCFPSHERIAEAAGCCVATVKKALRALEDSGLLTWCNRLIRRREHGPAGWRWRVYRTSNGYQLRDPRAQQAAGNLAESSKATFQPRTINQDIFSSRETSRRAAFAPQPPLISTRGVQIGPELAAQLAAMAIGRA